MKLGIFGRGCNIVSTHDEIYSARHPIPGIIGRNEGRILCSMAMLIAV